jgi:hypothetical protein
MKKFKAKVPFAAIGEIFSPGDEGRADAHLVDSWVEVEYCEDLGHVEELETEEKEPEQFEAPDEPAEPLEDVSDQIPDEDDKEPENEEIEPENSEYDNMKYPELKKAAKKANIKGYNTMKQSDLIAALKGE